MLVFEKKFKGENCLVAVCDSTQVEDIELDEIVLRLDTESVFRSNIEAVLEIAVKNEEVRNVFASQIDQDAFQRNLKGEFNGYSYGDFCAEIEYFFEEDEVPDVKEFFLYKMESADNIEGLAEFIYKFLARNSFTQILLDLCDRESSLTVDCLEDIGGLDSRLSYDMVWNTVLIDIGNIKVYVYCNDFAGCCSKDDIKSALITY